MNSIKLSALLLIAGLSVLGCGRREAKKAASMPEPIQEAPMEKAEKLQYNCPMHPEVVQDQPGRCPKCGMNLEQVSSPALHEGEPHEKR